jgi:hypothetical protein
MEDEMIDTQNTRRRPDGSTNFDHYERLARGLGSQD